jgi:hypothetical protein
MMESSGKSAKTLLNSSKFDKEKLVDDAGLKTLSVSDTLNSISPENIVLYKNKAFDPSRDNGWYNREYFPVTAGFACYTHRRQHKLADIVKDEQQFYSVAKRALTHSSTDEWVAVVNNEPKWK